MTQENESGVLVNLSTALAGVVEQVGPSVVRVDDGSRLTASGVIWSEDGIIVTTSHGVERDESLAIELADGTRHAATLVGRDPDTDLAVLRVNATGLPAIRQANSGDVKVGNLVMALGRPGTLGLQATIGIISAKIESQSEGQDEHILNTDAVLYPGFSGGALVNVNGEVAGITNLMFGRGTGVALGVPVVSRVVDAIQKHGRVQRGYLGISTQAVPLPTGLLKKLDLAQERGLLVVQVESGGPAEQGGVYLGDIIIGLDDQVVQDVDGLRSKLGSMYADQTVSLRLIRGGELQNVQVTLGARS